MAVDLFPALNEVNKKRNLRWYGSLSSDDQKTVHPFVFNRWLSGTNDPAQIIRLNAFVNPYLFSLGQDKELLFQLLSAASTGRTSRLSWVKPLGSGDGSKAIQVIADYYEVSLREAVLYRPQISHDTIIEMAEELGWESDDLTKLKKELTGGPGSNTKSSGGKTGTKRSK